MNCKKKKMMNPEDTGRSVCELDPMWIYREEQRENGKIVSLLAEGARKKDRGLSREREQFNTQGRLQGLGMEEVALEMSSQAWEDFG